MLQYNRCAPQAKSIPDWGFNGDAHSCFCASVLLLNDYNYDSFVAAFLNKLSGFTLPTGTNGELSFNLGGVQGVILCDQEGLKRGPVHKQRHGGELHVQHIVMPLFVTHLGGGETKNQRQ